MPSLRLVAGPNGSGKTSLTKVLREEHSVPLGQYLNPDDIAKHIALSSKLNIPLGNEPYLAAQIAQEISIGLRDDWIADHLSFTYESVMSHESHLETVKRAKSLGYKCYLYYICTSDPELNKARVGQRVMEGGHDVPSDRIVSRYNRSLEHLSDMLSICHRAFLFDNSKKLTFFAEVTPDGYLDIIEDAFVAVEPYWFAPSVIKKWAKHKIRTVRHL